MSERRIRGLVIWVISTGKVPGARTFVPGSAGYTTRADSTTPSSMTIDAGTGRLRP